MHTPPDSTKPKRFQAFRRWLISIGMACIFGRFVRAQNARTPGISGAGLGLYLYRILVELHGGNL